MEKIINFLKKFAGRPTIKGKLIKKGSQASVKMYNVNAEQTMILFYMMVKQVAKSLHVDPRHFLNKLIDLDKRIAQNEKQEIRQAKYQHRGTRFQ